jgi:hypothetical protein
MEDPDRLEARAALDGAGIVQRVLAVTDVAG